MRIFLILVLFLNGCASLYDVTQDKIYSFSNSYPSDFKNSPLPVELQNLIGKTVWSCGKNKICENFKLNGFDWGENCIWTEPLEELIIGGVYIKEKRYFGKYLYDLDLLIRFQGKIDNKIYATVFSQDIYASLIDAFKIRFATENPYKKHPTWPQNDWERIKAGEVWIGMTREQAIYSLGHPKYTNRTVTASVVSEQWVYPYTFNLYFENDKLKGWQD